MHALEIGLFDEFAVFGEPITAETAAKKFQFNTASFRRFLDALVAMGLLKKEVSMKGRGEHLLYITFKSVFNPVLLPSKLCIYHDKIKFSN